MNSEGMGSGSQFNRHTNTLESRPPENFEEIKSQLSAYLQEVLDDYNEKNESHYAFLRDSWDTTKAVEGQEFTVPNMPANDAVCLALFAMNAVLGLIEDGKKDKIKAVNFKHLVAKNAPSGMLDRVFTILQVTGVFNEGEIETFRSEIELTYKVTK